MAQHDGEIADQLFPDFRGDLNLVLLALMTLNSGAALPAVTFPNMLAFNETDDILYMRNKANSAWVSVGKITGGQFSPFVAGAQLVQGTTTVKGIWESADGAESAALASNALCLTPLGLASVLCTEAALGLARYGTTAEVDAATAADRALSVLQFARRWKEGAAIATASTLVKPAEANRGGVYSLTGAVTVTALWSGETPGTVVKLRVASTPQFTNSANLIIPGGTRTFAAGDILEFTAEAGNVWRLTDALLANGKALVETSQPGKVLQTVLGTVITARSTSGSNIPDDGTQPASSEGIAGPTVSITPQNASSKIHITGQLCIGASAAGVPQAVALFDGAAANAFYVVPSFSGNASIVTVIPVDVWVDAGSTAARTFSSRAGQNSGTVILNGDNSGQPYGGGVFRSFLVAQEVTVP